ncbi:MAG: hypothetical protein V1779_13475 [bacterium]
MKIVNIFSVAFLLFSANLSLYAQSDSVENYTKNCIYADVSTVILGGSVSINYERMFGDFHGVRIGIGKAFEPDEINIAGGGDKGEQVIATTIMYNLHTRGNHKFEFGFGLSFPLSEYDYKLDNFFALSVGYKYQCNPTGGFIFRFGLSKVYYYGKGLHISLGYAF